MNSLWGICGQPALQTDQPRNIDVFFNADIDAKLAVFLWKNDACQFSDFAISMHRAFAEEWCLKPSQYTWVLDAYQPEVTHDKASISIESLSTAMGRTTSDPPSCLLSPALPELPPSTDPHATPSAAHALPTWPPLDHNYPKMVPSYMYMAQLLHQGCHGQAKCPSCHNCLDIRSPPPFQLSLKPYHLRGLGGGGQQ